LVAPLRIGSPYFFNSANYSEGECDASGHVLRETFPLALGSSDPDKPRVTANPAIKILRQRCSEGLLVLI